MGFQNYFSLIGDKGFTCTDTLILPTKKNSLLDKLLDELLLNKHFILTEYFEVDVSRGGLSDAVISGAGVHAGVVPAHVLDHHRTAKHRLLAGGQHVVLENEEL